MSGKKAPAAKGPQAPICLGAIARAHGVKGEMKIKTFTAVPADIAAYGPVTTEGGAKLTLSVLRTLDAGIVVARAKEVQNRNDAEALSKTKLYIERDRLPPTEDDDTFYHEDLIGLNAVADEDGAPLGRIAAMHDFGAGDVMELREIPGVKGARLVPFLKVSTPEVNLAAGFVTIAAEYDPRREDDTPEASQTGALSEGAND